MHNRLILLLVILIFLLSGCAFVKMDTSEQKKKLDSEIMLWQNFKIEGIIKLYSSEYNLIKDITIIKDTTQFKMVLYDTGLFGISPKPFARLTFDDSIKVDIPSINDPVLLEQIRSMADGLTIFKDGFFYELETEENLTDIIKTHKLEAKDMVLEFNSRMQLTKIKINNNNVEIRISRDFSLLPEEIEIYYQNKLSVIIEIDKFIIK